MRPNVGFACVTLLERAGFQIHVPEQTCCGQIAFNNGDPQNAKKLAWQLIQTFDAFDFVVIPSGSCAGMIKTHYPELFQDDPKQTYVNQFCNKVYELTHFLMEHGDISSWPKINLSTIAVTYHDSCAGLRELNIKNQPRFLLDKLTDVALHEMQETETCCGFGGTFCVKFPEISAQMASKKLSHARTTDAELVVGGDVSCLLNLAGRALREQSEDPNLKKLSFRHIAEVLIHDEETPPIGEAHPGEKI